MVIMVHSYHSFHQRAFRMDNTCTCTRGHTHECMHARMQAHAHYILPFLNGYCTFKKLLVILSSAFSSCLIWCWDIWYGLSDTPLPIQTHDTNSNQKTFFFSLVTLDVCAGSVSFILMKRKKRRKKKRKKNKKRRKKK